MNTVLQNLVDALRDELQQYGELLATLAPSPALNAGPARAGILPQARDIAAQGAIIRQARARRLHLQRQFGWSLGQPEDCSFATLLPLSPAASRPLLRALTDEIAALEANARDRALSRHDALLRSAAWMLDCAGLFSPLEAPFVAATDCAAAV
jgi:hypothetical protein